MGYTLLYRIFSPLFRMKLRNVRGTEYLPDKPPFLIAANHVGFFDGPALASVIFRQYRQPIYYVTLEAVWRIWGKLIARNFFGMIPLDNKQKSGVLQESLEHLKAGHIVGIFPEAHRNKDEASLEQGKTGAIRMAITSGAPIIPVGIINTTGLRLGAALASLSKKNAYIDLSFGPPVDLSEFQNRPIDKPLLDEATRKLMLAIGRLCNKDYHF